MRLVVRLDGEIYYGETFLTPKDFAEAVCEFRRKFTKCENIEVKLCDGSYLVLFGANLQRAAFILEP